MNKFEKDVKRTVGEILDEHGFSFASDLSQHPSDCLVFRSPEVLLRFSWDRGDVLTDVSPNRDYPNWYPLQHVLEVLKPAFNLAGGPPQKMATRLVEEQQLIRSLDNDLKSTAVVLSYFLPGIKDKLGRPNFVTLARLQEVSQREELDTIERIFKKH